MSAPWIKALVFFPLFLDSFLTLSQFGLSCDRLLNFGCGRLDIDGDNRCLIINFNCNWLL